MEALNVYDESVGRSYFLEYFVFTLFRKDRRLIFVVRNFCCEFDFIYVCKLKARCCVLCIHGVLKLRLVLINNVYLFFILFVYGFPGTLLHILMSRSCVPPHLSSTTTAQSLPHSELNKGEGNPQPVPCPCSLRCEYQTRASSAATRQQCHSLCITKSFALHSVSRRLSPLRLPIKKEPHMLDELEGYPSLIWTRVITPLVAKSSKIDR